MPLLLVGAALVEIAVAFRRAAFKHGAGGTVVLIRLGAVAALGALAFTGLIAWGPRFYAFAFALVALAVVAILRALRFGRRPQPTGVPESWRRHAWQAAGTSILLAVAAAPAILIGEYEPLPTTGPYAVSTTVHTYVETQRADPFSAGEEPRRLTVQLWFPVEGELTADGDHPLLVFSHGATGVRSSNESLMRELASHGYVTASLDHPHHSLYATGDSGRRTWVDLGFLSEIGSEDPRTDKERSFRLYQEWLNVRTADISFVIDRLLADASTAGAAPGVRLIDAGTIVVAGHSLGGSAALALGRTRPDIDAVIALEAPLLGDVTGVQDGEFVWLAEPYPVPVLNVYSDTSWNHLDEWSQYAANNALLAGDDDNAVNYHVSGAGHFGLTDLSLSSPLLTRLADGQPSDRDPAAVLGEVNRVSLAFLDQHLR